MFLKVAAMLDPAAEAGNESWGTAGMLEMDHSID
jgi:hypothetical protein